jgi:hypothetical protein
VSHRRRPPDRTRPSRHYPPSPEEHFRAALSWFAGQGRPFTVPQVRAYLAITQEPPAREVCDRIIVTARRDGEIVPADRPYERDDIALMGLASELEHGDAVWCGTA